jgi:hypothetical protein
VTTWWGGAVNSDIWVGLKIENYADVAAGHKTLLRRARQAGKPTFLQVGAWIAFPRQAQIGVGWIKSNQALITMETIETLKAEVKKLSSQAVQAKLDLHDLSEDLPTGWERIMEVAGKTMTTYQKLAEARQKLTALGG